MYTRYRAGPYTVFFSGLVLYVINCRSIVAVVRENRTIIILLNGHKFPFNCLQLYTFCSNVIIGNNE